MAFSATVKKFHLNIYYVIYVMLQNLCINRLDLLIDNRNCQMQEVSKRYLLVLHV